MATTLTYGFVKPADGDKGSTFWDQLAADLQQLNDHTHDGLDSSLIAPTAIVATTQSVSPMTLDAATGLYYSDVTLPTGITFDGQVMDFVVTASGTPAEVGARIYPSTLKLSATVYRLTVMGNDLTIKVVYR